MKTKSFWCEDGTFVKTNFLIENTCTQVFNNHFICFSSPQKVLRLFGDPDKDCLKLDCVSHKNKRTPKWVFAYFGARDGT